MSREGLGMVAHSQAVLYAWTIAAQEAYAAHSKLIEPAHFMIAICRVAIATGSEFEDAWPSDPETVAQALREREDVLRLFDRTGIDPDKLKQCLRALFKLDGKSPTALVVIHRSAHSRAVFKDAERIAAMRGHSHARLVDLLDALEAGAVRQWETVLGQLGRLEAWNAAFAARKMRITRLPALCEVAEKRETHSPRKIPRDTVATPLLDRMARDLTRLAAEGKLDPVIGREAETRLLAAALMRRRKRNALLLGDAGVGKTAVVEGLAALVSAGILGPQFDGMRVCEINIGDLIAGTQYRGQFEERLQTLVREAIAAGVVLFIDEFHTVIGAGDVPGGADAANLLKAPLARGELQVIGATTVDEYRRHIERDAALSRRFQVVWIGEPDREQTVAILRVLRDDLEAHHGLTIDDAAITSAVDLSMRFLGELRLPDKAIELLDQACASARVGVSDGTEAAPAGTTVGAQSIADIVAARCKVPVTRLTEDEGRRLLKAEAYFRRYVIGQEEAISTVADALRMSRAGLTDMSRPTNAFLFAGPTGTGKTELAKVMTRFLFGDERRLIRIDMSEYMERHAVSRLVGAPPGYVGHHEPGQLTDAVRTNPYSIVLLDEIEKAHPDVLNILLQVLGEGRLTDARGTVVSFRDAVIVMTTNVGVAVGDGKSAPGFIRAASPDSTGDPAMLRQSILAELEKALIPELLNRIGDLVYFYPLDRGACRAIVDKHVGEIRRRLEARNATLTVSEEGYERLIRDGFDPRYGVRELARVTEKHIARPASKILLSTPDRIHEALDLLFDGARLRVVEDNSLLRA